MTNRPASDRDLRLIHLQIERWVEAHIFVAFLFDSLTVTLRMKLGSNAPGLTPREVLRSLATIQPANVHVPTTDGRELVTRRYTKQEAGEQMILDELNLMLPQPPPPRTRWREVVMLTHPRDSVVQTLG